MAIFDLTQSPSSLSMELVANTALFSSPLIASAQTLDRGGLKWRATLNFTNISKAKRAELMGLAAACRGQANRLRVPVHDNPARGVGTSATVSGASQTGSSLNLAGAGTQTNWIRAGDYLSVDVGGEHELKMCTADANSSGGAVTVNFEPRLRASPANAAAVYVGNTGNVPEGIFVLDTNIIGWSSEPFQSTSPLTQMVWTLLEDVFATQ
jgi:hypothetical protein